MAAASRVKVALCECVGLAADEGGLTVISGGESSDSDEGVSSIEYLRARKGKNLGRSRGGSGSAHEEEAGRVGVEGSVDVTTGGVCGNSEADKGLFDAVLVGVSKVGGSRGGVEWLRGRRWFGGVGVGRGTSSVGGLDEIGSAPGTSGESWAADALEAPGTGREGALVFLMNLPSLSLFGRSKTRLTLMGRGHQSDLSEGI